MQSFIEIIQEYYPLLIQATVTTLLLSVLTIVFALLFGAGVALLKLSKNKLISYPSAAYVEFIRGTPLMVQIYLVFYGLPLLGINFPPIELFGMDFDRLIAGTIALTINSSAYVCEIIRGGINSIDKGQMEASRSLGFGKMKSMMLVVFPQAFKNILPSLVNEFVSVIKNSSQVMVLGIAELMYTANTIRSVTYKPFAPFVIISVIYFIMTFIFSSNMNRLEKNWAKKTRS